MTPKFFKQYWFFRNFVVVIYCLYAINSKAQNQFGLTTGNYAGLYNLQINPANICFEPITFEINIIGVDGYINNNDFYAAPTFLPRLAFNDNYNRLRLQNHFYSPDSLKSGNFLLERNIQNNGYLFGGANILGPSFLFTIGRKRAMAFTSGSRTHFSGTNISNLTALGIFEGSAYSALVDKQMDMKNTKFSLASWAEIGISYAQVVYDNKKFTHRLGGSLKALFGIIGGYAYDKGFNGINKSGPELILENSTFAYAYAGPATDNKLKKTSSSDLAIRGLGASFDLGYSIQKNEIAGTRYCPSLYNYGNHTKVYKWKAGVSLLDIGAIQYFKNAFATNINNANLTWGKSDTLVGYGIEAIDNSLRSYVGAASNETFKKFWLILPSAFSAQFDYNINASYFVNATIIQRITVANIPSLSRMNTVAIIPRFESEKMTISLPFILNEYKDLSLGLAVRYKFVTIGSDRFGETFGFQNLYGANLYLAFKYSVTNKKTKWKRLF